MIGLHVTDERTAAVDDQSSDVEIPSAFLRAFQPTLADRAADLARAAFQSVRAWLDRRADAVWMPRAVDPVDELKNVWLSDYGLAPWLYDKASARARRDALSRLCD